MRKIGLLALCMLLIAGVTAYAEMKNPDTFIKVTYRTIPTLDPATAYTTTSSMVIENVYEMLVRRDGSFTDKFIPCLATEVPSLENGGISQDGLTYTFKIRPGVKFHEGGDLTASDVEYSFERNMITDQDGGPSWMLLEALTGNGATRDGDGKILEGVFEKIMNAVETKDDTVILHLPKPYPPLISILANGWATVQDKEWVVAQGGWDGTLENAPKANNPAFLSETLQNKMNGTGAFKMKSWDPSKELVFERFDGYWGEKPKLKSAILKYVQEWNTRKLMLMNGDADYVSVDTPYVPEMKDLPGIVAYKVPQLAVGSAHFCQKVNPENNTSIGSGKLDGEGIPPDFFSDINVRKAFLHCFDRELFQADVLKNIETVPTNPNVPGLPYAIDVPIYEFDLEKAAEYMKKAWGGQVWEKGFKMTINYNVGESRREGVALMLAENMNKLNPKFKVETAGVEFRDYSVKYRQLLYPVFVYGWSADYADPHNFLYTYMHSNGSYGRVNAYVNPEIDKLCDEGISTMDPQKRAEIYAKLQNLWYEEALGLAAYQYVDVRHYRDSIQGFVPNPQDGDASEWLFRLSKEEPKK